MLYFDQVVLSMSVSFLAYIHFSSNLRTKSCMSVMTSNKSKFASAQKLTSHDRTFVSKGVNEYNDKYKNREEA